MLLDVWNLLLQRPADMSFVAGLLLFFYLHMAITFGKDVKQAYLQEVLKEKGERDRERKKNMVSVFSISDQKDSDHQCSSEITYPNK